MNLTLLFISHDLSVVRHLSDRVAVMYLSEIVELAPAATMYREARHPYTQYLIASIPKPDPRANKTSQILTGEIPSPLNPPPGCRFNTRFPKAQDICRDKAPAMRLIASDNQHQVACHFAEI